MHNLIEVYKTEAKRLGFALDPMQLRAVEILNSITIKLTIHVVRNIFSENSYKHGLYLWGGVGRGKTYMMDLFFNNLPFDNKLRMHFYHFMKRIHYELNLLKSVKNPLIAVAKKLKKETRVICFDEFYVYDIADALLLGKLIKALLHEGVMFIITSNVPPENLYLIGLQRTLFLPTITLLEKNMTILNLDNGYDYRLQKLQHKKVYLYPHDQKVDHILKSMYEILCSNSIEWNATLIIMDRPILCVALSLGVIWFQFKELCEGPRSANDYIAIAAQYHAVFLSEVPIFLPGDENTCRRFIMLIDEFYDKKVKLILSAAVPIAELYQGLNLQFEFQRTQSRLFEMQSEEYIIYK